jgi:hypothetical protein
MSNLLGDAPYRCLKHLEKSDDEEKPQASAICVRECLRVGRLCDIMDRARSSLSRFTNSASVSPISAWNTL